MTAYRTLPKLAFLGPAGTYSHQVAFDRFKDSVWYEARSTIKDVFDAVSEQIPFAVIPQENSIFGTVAETYDLLRSPSAGEKKFVRGEVTLRVQHALLVRKGVKREEVARVLSHEQALGQCRGFLARHMPGVILEKTASTAAAAQALCSPENGTCAAICSKMCADLYPDLEVLFEGIQDDPSGTARNLTRFYILATNPDTLLPVNSSGPVQRRALFRVSLGSPEIVCRAPTITQLMIGLGLPVRRVDRRPALSAEPFRDVYFVEVYEDGLYETNEAHWRLQLDCAVQSVKTLGGVAAVLGSWNALRPNGLYRL